MTNMQSLCASLMDPRTLEVRPVDWKISSALFAVAYACTDKSWVSMTILCVGGMIVWPLLTYAVVPVIEHFGIHRCELPGVASVSMLANCSLVLQDGTPVHRDELELKLASPAEEAAYDQHLAARNMVRYSCIVKVHPEGVRIEKGIMRLDLTHSAIIDSDAKRHGMKLVQFG